MVSQETQPVGTVQDLSLSSDTGVNDDSNPQQGKPHLHSQQSRNHCRGYISSTKRDSRKLFVGGLPGHVNLQEFHAFFEQFGTVIDSVVMMDRETKRSRGFGFVTFQDEAVAKNVLSMGHDEETDEDGPRKGKVLILGKECEVKAAEPKSMSTSCTNPTTKTKRKQERASKIMKAQGNNSNNVTGTEFAGNEEPFLYNMIGNHGNYVDLYSSLPPPEVVPVMMMMPQQGYYYPSPAVPSFHEPYYYQPYPVAEAVAPNAVAWYPQPTPVDFYSPYVGQAGIPAMPGVGAPAPILTGSFLPDNGAFTHVDVIPTTTQAFVPPSPPLETKQMISLLITRQQKTREDLSLYGYKMGVQQIRNH